MITEFFNIPEYNSDIFSKVNSRKFMNIKWFIVIQVNYREISEWPGFAGGSKIGIYLSHM